MLVKKRCPCKYFLTFIARPARCAHHRILGLFKADKQKTVNRKPAFMLKNYFKLALRNLVKRPGYSLLNILGLAIGITCCLLIFQYAVSYTHLRAHETPEHLVCR